MFWSAVPCAALPAANCVHNCILYKRSYKGWPQIVSYCIRIVYKKTESQFKEILFSIHYKELIQQY